MITKLDDYYKNNYTTILIERLFSIIYKHH